MYVRKNQGIIDPTGTETCVQRQKNKELFTPQTLNSCRSFRYAHGNESIIIINDLCKLIEIYIYARKNPLLQVILQQSTQTQQTWGTDI